MTRAPKAYVVLRERYDQQGPRVAFGLWPTRAQANVAIRQARRPDAPERLDKYNFVVVLTYLTHQPHYKDPRNG